MNGTFNPANFPVPQGQKFPGMAGYYTAANFPVPQGQQFPAIRSAKVIPITTSGPVTTKQKGMAGRYQPAVWSKSPFFAGTRRGGCNGMGDTASTDFMTQAKQFTSDYPIVAAGILLSIGVIAAKVMGARK